MRRQDGEIHGEITRFLARGFFKEIIREQRFLGTPAVGRVHRQQLGDELDGVLGHPLRIRQVRLECRLQAIRETRLARRWLELFPQAALFVEVRPFLFGRVPAGAKDQIQLGRLVGALEKARAAEHLRNDTADTPQVHLWRIAVASKQEFGWTVPQGDDRVGQASHVAVPATGEAPIGNLQLALFVDEQVGRLEVAVNHLLAMHVMHAAEELLRPRLDVILGETDFLGVQDASQIVFHVFEHHKDILRNRSTLFFVAKQQQQAKNEYR